ncbi:MAG: Rieske (2Fe-2S) protein [Haloferacaceae archaeon]
MTDHDVGPVDMLDEGGRVIVDLAGREVAVYDLGDGYVAYPNWCPHQGGPLCEGSTSGTVEATFDRETLETETAWTKEGEVVVCPWHGWEFDLRENEFLHDASIGLPAYSVSVEDGRLVVSV